MRRFSKHSLLFCGCVVIGAQTMALSAPAVCLCDGDVDVTNSVDIVDVTIVAGCANGIDCTGCTATDGCDVNCDGTVDYLDVGATSCQFLNMTDCCNQPAGACRGAINAPSCVFTSQAGCDVLQGTYYGDGTGCPVPAVSVWGMMLTTLGLIAASTFVLWVQRRRTGLRKKRDAAC